MLSLWVIGRVLRYRIVGRDCMAPATRGGAGGVAPARLWRSVCAYKRNSSKIPSRITSIMMDSSSAISSGISVCRFNPMVVPPSQAGNPWLSELDTPLARAGGAPRFRAIPAGANTCFLPWYASFIPLASVLFGTPVAAVTRFLHRPPIGPAPCSSPRRIPFPRVACGWPRPGATPRPCTACRNLPASWL